MTTPKRKRPAAKPKHPRQTKRDLIIEMLRRPEGATLSELIDTLGWQAHTVRAVISGIRLGRHGKQTFEPLPVVREIDDGRTRWRIVEPTA